MSLNKNAIIKIIGYILGAIGLSMLAPFFLSVYLEEEVVAHAFGVTAAFAIGTGIVLGWFTKSTSSHLSLRDGIFVVFFGWLTAALMGSLPYLISGTLQTFPDAFFESMSGFTTTGATIFRDIEALPKGIIFWRSFCQWLGGMGILVFVVSILPALGINGHNILSAETPGLGIQKLDSKHNDSARKLYLAYIAFTLLQVLLLKQGGMNYFDSMIFSFGSISSSGLTNYNNGLMHFDSPYIEAVVAIFMILSCINFSVYYFIFKRDLKRLIHNTEFKVFLGIMSVAAFLIVLDLRLTNTYNMDDSLRYGVFQTISFMTTTGNASTDFMAWPEFSQMLLTMLTFIGGSSASTGGGIKVIRIVILSKLIWRSFSVRIHPNAVIGIKLDHKPLASSTTNAIVAFFFVYMVVFFLGGFVISFATEDLQTAFLASSSMLCNTGASFGSMGIFGHYESFPSLIKLFMSFLMLAGRLEIYTVLLLFSKTFWNPYK
ncbi:MAG: TrkH family potassium uptake protein [Clostridia bacterium]|nr:TrkH family potassium uptake protein [Clostridia bacterium]